MYLQIKNIIQRLPSVDNSSYYLSFLPPPPPSSHKKLFFPEFSCDLPRAGRFSRTQPAQLSQRSYSAKVVPARQATQVETGSAYLARQALADQPLSGLSWLSSDQRAQIRAPEKSTCICTLYSTVYLLGGICDGLYSYSIGIGDCLPTAWMGSGYRTFLTGGWGLMTTFLFMRQDKVYLSLSAFL